MNIFEQAARKSLRFTTTVGMLSVEQLWTLPLTSASRMSLDTVAKTANSELKALTEESFVATAVKPGKPEAELRLEIVKHIIAVRIAENEAKADKERRNSEKGILLEALERKQRGAIEGLTEDEIKARIASL